MAGFDSWNKGGYVGLVPKFSGGPSLNLVMQNGKNLKRLLGEKDAWTIEISAHIDKRRIQCRVFRNASLENADIVEYAPCQALCS